MTVWQIILLASILVLATKMLGEAHDAPPREVLNAAYRFYDYEFERYWQFYRVWGRLTYNPETPAEVLEAAGAALDLAAERTGRRRQLDREAYRPAIDRQANADWVVVAFVQRQPGDRSLATGDPFADQRGFAKAGRCAHQNQLASGAGHAVAQPGAVHLAGLRGGGRELALQPQGVEVGARQWTGAGGSGHGRGARRTRPGRSRRGTGASDCGRLWVKACRAPWAGSGVWSRGRLQDAC